MIDRLRKFFATLALLSVELIVVIVLFILSLLVFFYITDEIIEDKNNNFDNTVFAFIHPFISASNTTLMRIITIFGSHIFLIPANIILALIFLLKKHRWYSLRVPVVSLGSFIVMSSLKLLFGRPRPDDPVYQAAMGFSYPSGHAMSSMTFFGLLIFLVWNRVRDRSVRWVLTIFLSIFILIIGFSRVYLRVHYASDVLAGFAMGVIWLVISLWAMDKIERYAGRKVAPTINESNNGT
jgi:undecaprenyl-diphosphatase